MVVGDGELMVEAMVGGNGRWFGDGGGDGGDGANGAGGGDGGGDSAVSHVSVRHRGVHRERHAHGRLHL